MDTTARLTRAFLKDHPSDCARILEGLLAEQSASLFSGCSSAIASKVIRQMSPASAAACLGSMPQSDSASILSELSFDATARIAKYWSSDIRARMFDALPPRTSKALDRILNYPETSVGALMDPMAFTLPSDIDVNEAKQRIEGAGGKVHYDLYVVNREQQLVGVVNLRDFIQASPSSKLSSIMSTQFVKLKPGVVLEQAAGAADVSKAISFPIVDKKDIFLGALSTEVLYEAIGRADPSRAKRDSVETVVALGELYWVTLSGLFFRPSPTRDVEPPRRPSPEIPHGR